MHCCVTAYRSKVKTETSKSRSSEPEVITILQHSSDSISQSIHHRLCFVVCVSSVIFACQTKEYRFYMCVMVVCDRISPP